MQMWEVSTKSMLKSTALSKGVVHWQFSSNTRLSYVTSSMASMKWEVNKTSKPTAVGGGESKTEEMGEFVSSSDFSTSLTLFLLLTRHRWYTQRSRRVQQWNYALGRNCHWSLPTFLLSANFSPTLLSHSHRRGRRVFFWVTCAPSLYVCVSLFPSCTLLYVSRK